LQKLPRDFYARDPILVARELLGKFLVHNSHGIERIGRIVEVEAYLGPHDLAAHSSKGLTPRTQALFGPPGHAYVYLIYGMYHCFNTVTGHGSGVLLRALEPVKNIEDKTQGPGLLCRAMGIDKSHYGHDLTSPMPRSRRSSAGRGLASPMPAIGRGASCASTSAAILSFRSLDRSRPRRTLRRSGRLQRRDRLRLAAPSPEARR
jgi:DNA-3-methyladenine glycosylase